MILSTFLDNASASFSGDYEFIYCIYQSGTLQCIQFKTDQAADVKKLDELNTFFLSLMAGMNVEDFAASCAAGEQGGAAGKGPQTRRNRKG